MFLIDTNVISETTRSRPHPGVLRWLGSQERLHLPAVVVQELAFGVARAPDDRRGRLDAWLAALLDNPAAEVVPFAVEAAVHTGRLLSRRAAEGKPISWADAQIAGTGLARAAIVVTRNTRHFEGLGVAVLDPFVG